MISEKKNFKIRKELFISSSKTKNIKEDYDYIRELGAGGYGVVFLAQHKITSKPPLTQTRGEPSRPSPRTTSRTRRYSRLKSSC